MDTLALIGQILFGGFFIFMSTNHFLNRKQMVDYAQSKKAPMPPITVPLTGALLLLGGVGILLGAYKTVSLWLLIIFFITVTPIMHNFWALSGNDKMTQMVNFMKNMAILGALLLLLSFSDLIWPIDL